MVNQVFLISIFFTNKCVTTTVPLGTFINVTIINVLCLQCSKLIWNLIECGEYVKDMSNNHMDIFSFEQEEYTYNERPGTL